MIRRRAQRIGWGQASRRRRPLHESVTTIHHSSAIPSRPAADSPEIAGQPSPPGAIPDSVSEAERFARACTAAQLRRFIKSRPYVPLHELRRRFELGGETDEVSRVETPDGPVYLGLPDRESELLQELLRQGEIGVELSMDPAVRVVVGVYPMRPVPRL
jgi:hypothetical protein